MSNISTHAVVRCLGGFSLELRGHPVNRWRAGKARELFLYLLINRGRTVDREELHAALWPDRNRSAGSSSVKVAKHAVHQILSGQQAAEEQPAAEIVFNEYGYTLKVHDAWLDFEEFERLCNEGHRAAARSDRITAAAYYRRALELHVGDFLPGESADWAREQQDWVRSLALGAADFLLQEALDRGELPEVIDVCRRTLDIDPYQEDVYRTLIQVHGDLGQLGQARSWYKLCSARMSNGLDIDVSPDTQRLFERVLRVHDAPAQAAVLPPGRSSGQRVTTP
ncbi:BTAD domain-containing putative transcriptional regulator [Streptomyces sp. NPDC019396]|uniref:AfsR/SARP family transcriptional regulator n=1 Tax=Streptomyces sp. NPDC019396 TaxID=3154687 RepID=UPI0033F10473